MGYSLPRICLLANQSLRKKSSGRSNASSLPSRPEAGVSPWRPTLRLLQAALSSWSRVKNRAAPNHNSELLKHTALCSIEESVPLQSCRKFLWSDPACCSPDFPTWLGLVRWPYRHTTTSCETFSCRNWPCHWSNIRSSGSKAIWSSGNGRPTCTSQLPPLTWRQCMHSWSRHQWQMGQHFYNHEPRSSPSPLTLRFVYPEMLFSFHSSVVTILYAIVVLFWQLRK